MYWVLCLISLILFLLWEEINFSPWHSILKISWKTLVIPQLYLPFLMRFFAIKDHVFIKNIIQPLEGQIGRTQKLLQVYTNYFVSTTFFVKTITSPEKMGFHTIFMVSIINCFYIADNKCIIVNYYLWYRRKSRSKVL